MRRDPRVSIVVTSTGSPMPRNKTVTYKGMCTLHDDQETKDWFYPELSTALNADDPARAEAFQSFLDSPRRVILEVEPDAAHRLRRRQDGQGHGRVDGVPRRAVVSRRGARRPGASRPGCHPLPVPDLRRPARDEQPVVYNEALGAWVLTRIRARASRAPRHDAVLQPHADRPAGARQRARRGDGHARRRAGDDGGVRGPAHPRPGPGGAAQRRPAGPPAPARPRQRRLPPVADRAPSSPTWSPSPTGCSTPSSTRQPWMPTAARRSSSSPTSPSGCRWPSSPRRSASATTISPGSSGGPTTSSCRSATTPPASSRRRGYLVSSREFAEYFGAKLADRRAHPTGDIISDVATAELDGEQLSEPEMLGMLQQFLVAGNETTTNLLTNMVHRLAVDPELQARVRADRSLVEPFVEEALHFEAPVGGLFRQAREDVDSAARWFVRVTTCGSCTPRPTGTATSSRIPTASTSSGTTCATHVALRPRRALLHRCRAGPAGGPDRHRRRPRPPR